MMTAVPGPVGDDLVASLVMRAQRGDQLAWDALVERYAPLVWGICRRHQLGRPDTDDVGQSVWLHLTDHLRNIRDPVALPTWLATTTTRECTRILSAARRPYAADQMIEAGNIPCTAVTMTSQELLLTERHAALREAFTCLPPGCQRLLALLVKDPPVPPTEISAMLGIPVGSIEPTRSRCLQELRRHPAIAALIDAGQASAPLDAHANDAATTGQIHAPLALGTQGQGSAPAMGSWPGRRTGRLTVSADHGGVE